MSILVPFLNLLHRRVARRCRLTNAWRQEVVGGASSLEASRRAFPQAVSVPGAVALLTNALAFAVIMFIQNPHRAMSWAITACLGVLLMIITNKMILPIPADSPCGLEELLPCPHRRHQQGQRAARRSGPSSPSAPSRATLCTCSASARRCCWGTTWAVRAGLVIGDSGTGAPRAAPGLALTTQRQQTRIAKTYLIGVDVLTIIARGPRTFGG